VIGEFKVGGRFGLYPIAVTVGILLAYYVLFSESFKRLRKKNKYINMLGKYGMLPAIVIAIIVGPIAKELPIPTIEFGTIIHIPNFKAIIKTVTPFGIELLYQI